MSSFDRKKFLLRIGEGAFTALVVITLIVVMAARRILGAIIDLGLILLVIATLVGFAFLVTIGAQALYHALTGLFHVRYRP